ncbi:MAG TPA: hypothetical protein VKG85_12385 [Actinomycetes bacterium]|nr:hypothetical protein [Actinomycetes bacterium]
MHAETPAGDVHSQDVVSGSESAVIESARVRRLLGFRDDLGYVQALAQTQDGLRSFADYGVFLSTSEVDEVLARDRIPVVRAPALAWGSRQPGFAGTYIDHNAGGQIVLRFAGRSDLSELDGEIRRLIGEVDFAYRDRVRVDEVAYSLDQLRGVRDAILALRGASSTISGVGIEPSRNAVVVTATDTVLARQQVDANLPELGAGPPILYLEGENADETCGSRASCGGSSTRRGGVRVERGSSGSCTSGFSLRDGLDYDVITAGHCWYTYNSGTITSGGQSYGSISSANVLDPGTWCDCRLIETNDEMTGPIYYHSDTVKAKTVTSREATPSEGDVVRLAGQYTQSSGTVSVVDYSYTSGTCGCTVHGAVLADYLHQNGDSGGSVTNSTGGRAFGIHTGSASGLGRFSTAWWAEQYFGGTVVSP